MFYKLKPNIALRGWFGDPFTYINYADDLIYKLSKEELEVLKRCDGENAISENESIKLFLKEGIIEESSAKSPIGDWQKYKFCENNCFSTAYWAITGRCNYNCKHCFMAADYHKDCHEFTLKECKCFLDSCAECGIYSVIITGGEPFLHPDFCEILRECAKRNIKVKEILTNGSLINESVLDKFSKIGINPTLKVSFDGIGHHNWMRGVPDAEERTIHAIKLLKSRGFNVCVQMCIHKGNFNSMYPTAKLLERIGVDKIRILRTSETPRWENYLDMRLNAQEYFDISLKFIDTYIQNNHTVPIEIFKFLAINPKSKKYSCIPVKKNGNQFEKIPICSEMRFSLNVSSSGDIVPCSRLTGYYKKYGINFGNVKKDNLQQLLLSSKYFNEASKTVQDLLNLNGKCQKCEFLSMCYLGCRAGAAVFAGGIYKNDPSNCVYFQNGYHTKSAKLLSAYGYAAV